MRSCMDYGINNHNCPYMRAGGVFIMKKTNLLLSLLCLAMASTSLTFGAAHFYKVEVSNQSPYNIEAIETFIPAALLLSGKHFVYPWAGIVSGLGSGSKESITASEMTDRFPFIQVNGVIYKLAHANGQPVHIKKAIV